MIHFNFKLISRVFGILLLIESFFILISGVVAVIYRESALWSFLISTVVTAGIGALMVYNGRTFANQIGKREGFLIVSFSWVLFSLFGMLPFLISGSIETVTDAFFETMSGFTTTGATILTNIDSLPKSILFWRSIIQWLGGMGIIVFTLAVMPIFRPGGIQLFHSEVPGLTQAKIRPRIQHTAIRLWTTYLAITLICAGFLRLSPLSASYLSCPAFTTLLTVV